MRVAAKTFQYASPWGILIPEHAIAKWIAEQGRAPGATKLMISHPGFCVLTFMTMMRASGRLEIGEPQKEAGWLNWSVAVTLTLDSED